MEVLQIFTDSFLRNFTYIIEGDNKQQFIIDPWNAKACLELCHAREGVIKGVINTHEHWDHTRGNKEIQKKTECSVYAHPVGEGKIPGANIFLNDGDEVIIDPHHRLRAMHTPGHSKAHLCLLLIEKNSESENVKAIFTGDILFNAGVGNCHNGGDAQLLYQTISSQFQTLASDIIVYPGHEYLKNNLGFTLDREPSNEEAKNWLRNYDSIDWKLSPVTTTIGDELKINTFLRLDSLEIRKGLFPDENSDISDEEVFIKLREKRDDWNSSFFFKVLKKLKNLIVY